jgi:hypothetical protein
MATLNDVQKVWVNKFLGLSGSSAKSGSSLAQPLGGTVPTEGNGVAPISGTTGDTTTGPLIDQPAPMAGTIVTGPSAPTGGGQSGSGPSGGSSGAPSGKPDIFAVDEERVVKLNKLGTKVFKSVSSQAHADAWNMHKQPPPVPVAYQVDKFIYVDETRWPEKVEKPRFESHAPGGPKIKPSPSKTVPPMQFPNNPDHTLQGTSKEPGGGAGKGPGGTVAVPDGEIAATHRKAPGNTRYTFTSPAHTDIWAHLGNKPPAPIAFMQSDGTMRVDVERWALNEKKWSAERLGQIGLKLKPDGTPLPPVPQLDEKAAAALYRQAEDHKKAAKAIDPKEKKGASQADVDKIRKENVAITNDIEKVTKDLRAHPDLKGIPGATSKEFYANLKSKMDTVRTGAGQIGFIALKVGIALELVNDVRFILDSKDMSQFISRSVKVGEKHAERWIIFGAMKLIFKIRDPITIIVTIVFSSDRSDHSLGAADKFKNLIAEAVNKVRPGSIRLRTATSTSMGFNTPDAERMFKEQLDAAGNTLKENAEKSLARMGYEDALSGAPTKRKFEVSEIEKEIAKVDGAWMAQVYGKANGEGDRKREDAMRRAEAAGVTDGKAGKPYNFAALKKWPELDVLITNWANVKEVTGTNDKHGGQILLDRYEFLYNRGYAEGEKAGKALVLDRLDVNPNGFTMGAHTNRQLTVTATFTNKSTKIMTGEVEWRSSNENAVRVSAENGVVRAMLGKPGNADVTASYKGIHGAKEVTISVGVNMPTLRISPENPKTKVGQKLQFRALSIDKDDDPSVIKLGGLDSSLISWVTDDKNIVDIDRDGNASIKSVGRPVKIYASYTNTPVQANTTVTIG